MRTINDWKLPQIDCNALSPTQFDAAKADEGNIVTSLSGAALESKRLTGGCLLKFVETGNEPYQNAPFRLGVRISASADRKQLHDTASSKIAG